MEKLSGKQKKELNRIIIALVIFAVLFVTEHFILEKAAFFNRPSDALNGASADPRYVYARIIVDVLYFVPYFIVGADVIRKCLMGIKNRQLFDESFLMTIATIGAFGCGEFGEAVAVMLFYQVGEFFQSYAVGKSRGAITELMSIAPDFANRETDEGSVETIDPDDIEVGDILVVKPGEKIPTDGRVVEGKGLINTSALTGESMPREVSEGDEVISGCINGDALLRIQAEKEYDDSTVAQILELVENASSRKSVTENFITRFAKYYTPAVVIAAVVLAFIPPIISGDFAGEFGKWVLRACTFLVISCPCALVISVPLAFFGGIGAASKIGMLVKGSNYLELMSQIDTVVTDKTGTLTEGRFSVSYVEAVEGMDTDELIRLAAAAESGSTHPIASAITEACARPYPASKIKDIQVSAGGGVKAIIGRYEVAVGNLKYLEDEGVSVGDISAEAAGTYCHVAKDGEYIGTIVVSDRPKENAREAVREMIDAGVRRVVMLTGDSEEVAASVAGKLGIKDYKSGLLPQDKVKAVEEYLGAAEAGSIEKSGNIGEGKSRSVATVKNGGSDSEGYNDGDKDIRDGKRINGKLSFIGDGRSDKGKLAFIGDGINDAPVLSRADVGIAMGSLGSDAAIEAADIVIMDDDLGKIPKLIQIAKKTMRISRTNIAFALLVKFSCLILGAVGLANMWIAVFADVGVAVICILNSMRMLID